MKTYDLFLCLLGVVVLTLLSVISGMKIVESHLGMTVVEIKEAKRLCELDIPRNQVCTVRVAIVSPVSHSSNSTEE